MTFGQTIKTLRREANMTQEQLAELLSISPQAVSRWETDAAMPDISLLPPLANLFHVTTDRLLGMETYQKDQRKAEFDEAFHQYWNHDDKQKNYEIAVRAAAEYPGNMEYMEWLASAEYYIAIPQSDDAEYTRLLESAVKHYRIVLDNAQDPKLYAKALHGIVLSLHMLGKNDEAKEYARKEEDEDKRNEMLLWCLQGQEQEKLSQKIANTHLSRFLFYLTFSQKDIEVYETTEQILHLLFPDGNLQYYHNTLQYNCLNQAFHWCRVKDYDRAIDALARARHHAEEMTRVNHTKSIKFTAPLFDLIEETRMVTDSDVTDVDDFIRSLQKNRCFAPIRDSDAFRALLQK